MIYILCAAVVIAAVPLAWLIKREGERSWRRHRTLVLAAPIAAEFLRFQVTIADAFTPALVKSIAEIQRMQVALEGLGEALRAYNPEGKGR